MVTGWTGSVRGTVVSLLLLISLVLSSIAFAAVPTGRQIARDTTGANVDRMEILSQGIRRGEIRSTADGIWEERTNPASDNPVNERVFVYRERLRDAQAVLLWDANRGIELELNIAARKVYYTDNNIRRQEIYDIGSATRAEFADGHDIRYITVADSPDNSALVTISNDSGNMWVMREGAERTFFYERFRSESMIELRDYTNSVILRFDFSGLTAVFSSNDGRRSQSAAIVDISNDVPPLPAKPALAGSQPNGLDVMQMTLGGESGEYGLLVMEPSQVWTIRSRSNGNVIGSYYETGRDDWTVYLAIDAAGSRPALRADLYEKQVYDASSDRVVYIVPDATRVPAPAEQQVVRNTQYPPAQNVGGSAPATPAAPVPQAPQISHAQLGQVTYGENNARVGEYTNLGDGRWRDTNVYGGSLVLAEERRSGDAVYLKVPDRNETIQLNLTTRRINRLTSSSTAALYDILSTAELPPAPVAPPAQVAVAANPASAMPVTNTPTNAPTHTPAAATSSPPTVQPSTPPARPDLPIEDRQPLPPPVKLDTTVNPRLARASTSPTDCGKEGQRPCTAAPAIFVQAAASGGCPAGSDLFPLVRGGSCWSCPAGSRYIAPSDIEGPQGCTIPATQARAPARFTGLVEFFNCPKGGEARGLDNKCWQCPDGFLPDILEQADGPRGCFRDSPPRFTQATLTRSMVCPAGSNAELLDSGNCWKCPAGFSRSGSPPSWADACTTNIWDATFASLGAGSCAAGLENFRGVCERRGSCGAIGGRPCEILERTPSCDAGAREDFKTNSCVALQPGESPFIAGLGSVSEFYGDTIVAFCRETIGGIRFDDSTDLGLGANCTKDIFTGASCLFLAAAMGGKYAAMVSSAASLGPQFETFKRNVDAAYEAAPCNAMTETLSEATRHGSASGFSCPESQFWDPNGSCYSCPPGFSRTMNAVDSAGACVDKPANELARSTCAVYRAATQDLEGAVLCSKEVLESGVFLDRPLDLKGAQKEVCMAAGEFAYSIYALVGSVESPEKKSSRMLEALSKMTHAAGMAGAARKVTDKADNLGTAFSQLEHCE